MVKIVYGKVIEKNATDFWSCSIEAGADKYPKTIQKNKLKVIPNGINITAFNRNNLERQIIREQLGIADEEFVIGHVGRFSSDKNHDYLISIFDKVKNVIPEARLLLVGDGELLSTIKARIEKMGMDNSVFLTGSVDNPEKYYQAMDAFAFPSIFEGFGYVVLEAEAAGLPCVVSTGVPVDALVGKNVVRIPLDNESAWIEEIINCREKQIVNNNEAIKKAGYDIRETTQLVSRLYRAQL